jgi:hypothetical protein
MENLAGYIIRASFSQERMAYFEGTSREEGETLSLNREVGLFIFGDNFKMDNIL